MNLTPEKKVELFNHAVRRMLELTMYRDRAKKLIKLIVVVASGVKPPPNTNPQAELRSLANELILNLDKYRNNELVNPLLCDLANASLIPGFAMRVVHDVLPVAQELLADPCKSTSDKRPFFTKPTSSAPPPSSCS